jgi:indolepyruvate decarboxylase
MDRGIKHCFGIPGDYILPLYKTLEETNGIDAVVGTHEPNSAFSADAYARVNGLGVLLVTYGVGALNAMNGVACAYAEMSPLLVVSGAPPAQTSEPVKIYSPGFHNEVKGLGSQLKAFEPITELCLNITDPADAVGTINLAVNTAINKRRPVYLEIPTDLFHAAIPVSDIKQDKSTPIIAELDEAVDYFVDKISNAENPVIQTGIEIGRYNLQNDILKIVDSCNIPFVSTPLGKGVFPETSKNFLGIYAGILTPTVDLRNFIEGSGLVTLLGTKITDVNCGAYTADLKKGKPLIANSNFIGDELTEFNKDIPFELFVNELSRKLSKKKQDKSASIDNTRFDYGKSASVVDQYLHEVNEFLTEEHVLVADTGDSCYGSLFMNTKRMNGYFAPLFYNTSGFAVPAALGIQLADTGSRPVVLVGDGAFQMTGLEFSTMVKHKLNAVVIVFNNDGFGMQRVFQDGDFNTIGRWDYTATPALVGGGKSFTAKSPSELKNILQEISDLKNEPCLIEVKVDREEMSTGLRIFSEAVLREKTGVCPLQLDDGKACNHVYKCAFCKAPIWK